ncbi:hypothetical protein ASD32_08860 [Rhizobium sp. Root483D2]|nr:hypothetical protein ASD32_08860 [Rhizobium sp. Root483D2]
MSLSLLTVLVTSIVPVFAAFLRLLEGAAVLCGFGPLKDVGGVFFPARLMGFNMQQWFQYPLKMHD